jgi:hypothetical protein
LYHGNIVEKLKTLSTLSGCPIYNMDRIECLLSRNPFSIYEFELATAIQMNSTHWSNRNGKEGGRKNASPTLVVLSWPSHCLISQNMNMPEITSILPEGDLMVKQQLASIDPQVEGAVAH